MGEGEEYLGGVILRRLEISFSTSLVGRLFTECTLSGSNKYLLEYGEAETAADNIGIKRISVLPPDSLFGREGYYIIVEGGLTL